MTARRRKSGQKSKAKNAVPPQPRQSAAPPSAPRGNVGELLQHAAASADNGDFEAAADSYIQASALAPRDTEILDNLAEALLEAGRPDEAEAALRKSIKLSPAVGFEKYMYLSQLMGNTRDAVEVSKQGVDVLRREKASPATTPARMSELVGFEVSALCGIAETLLSVIEESNDVNVANELDSQVELSVGEALGVCESGSPGEVEASLALANLRLSQGRRQDACAAMCRIVQCMRGGLDILDAEDLSDDDIVKAMALLPPMLLRTAIGKQLVEVGLWEDAISVFSSTLFECDFNIEVLYLLILASMNAGEIEQALAFVDRARSVLESPEGYTGSLPDGALDELEHKVREGKQANKGTTSGNDTASDDTRTRFSGESTNQEPDKKSGSDDDSMMD